MTTQRAGGRCLHCGGAAAANRIYCPSCWQLLGQDASAGCQHRAAYSLITAAGGVGVNCPTCGMQQR